MATITYNNRKVSFDLNEYFIIPDGRVIRAETAGGKISTKKFHDRRRIAISRRGLPREQAEMLDALLHDIELNAGAEFDFDADDCMGEFWSFGPKLLISNNGLSGTTTRADTATYYDHKLKQVLNVNSGVTRYGEGKYGEYALLTEPSFTNLLVRSEEFTHAAWTASNLTVTDNFSEEFAPDGTVTAALLTENASSTGEIYQTSGTAASTFMAVFSIWLKLGFAQNVAGARNVDLKLRSSTNPSGHVVSKTVTLTPEWQRFYVAKTTDTAWDDDLQVAIANIKDSVRVFSWGAQLERLIAYPTSYIPVSAATDARATEYHEWSLTEGQEFNRNEGAISFWFYPITDGTSSNGPNQVHRIFELYSTNRQFIALQQPAQENKLRMRFGRAIDTSEGVNIDVTPNPLTVNTWHWVYCEWNHVSGAFSTALYVNNASQGTGSTRASTAAKDMALRIGSRGSDEAYAGHISELTIWKRVLTSTERSTIYARPRGIGQFQNRWKVKYLSHQIAQGEVNDRVDFNAEFVEALQ